MMMKWNTEWVDLQNLERMVAECWRMNPQQLQKYYEDLDKQRDLVFAGDLGLAFLKILGSMVAGEPASEWSDIQKDIRMIQQMIQRGQDWTEDAWRSQYQELIENPEFFFYTRLGGAFTKRLADQLEVNISMKQRLIRKDIRQIKKICDSCDFQNEEDVRRVLSMLERNEGKVFDSWIGEGFYAQMRERFAPPQTPPEDPKDDGDNNHKKGKWFSLRKRGRNSRADETQTAEPSKKARTQKNENEKRTRRHAGRRAVLVLSALSVVCMSVWLHTQFVRNGNRHDLLQLIGQFVNSNGGDATENISPFAADAKGSSFGMPDGAASNDAGQADTSNADQAGTGNAGQADTDSDNQADASGADQTDGQPDRRSQAARHVHDDTATLDRTAQTGDETEPVEPPEILEQYQALHKQYPDVFGWLRIPGMDIDCPVMQCKTDTYQYYYLHHDYTGAKSMEGSVFVDKDSNCYPMDNNLVLYGHNMANGHVFGTLKQYEEKSFYEEHQQIEFDTIYETGVYEVMAVVLTRVLYQDEEGFRYYRLFNYENEEEFQDCLDFVRENQLFDTGKEIRYGDRLIMLSTCNSALANGRLVIVARKTAKS